MIIIENCILYVNVIPGASQAEQPVRLSTHEDPQPAPMEQFRSIHDWVGCDSCGVSPPILLIKKIE